MADQLPTLQQIRDMADRLRADPRCAGDSATRVAQDVVGALVHGGPTPPLLVKRALQDHWPEAAALVYLREIDQHRVVIHALSYRPQVWHYLDKLKRDWAERDEIEACPYGDADADALLAEWDSVKTPSQVPEPIRVAALARLKACGLLDQPDWQVN